MVVDGRASAADRVETDAVEADVEVGHPPGRDEHFGRGQRRCRRPSSPPRRRRRPPRESASRPVRTVMPSRSNTSATTRAASGSSGMQQARRALDDRDAASRTARTPERVRSRSRRRRTRSTTRAHVRPCTASRLVHSSSSRRGAGRPARRSAGSPARCRSPRRRARRRRCVVDLDQHAADRHRARPAGPRRERTSPPAPSSRSTATRSSQSSVASARIRCATGRSPAHLARCRPCLSTRRASASTSAPRTIILDGMHP